MMPSSSASCSFGPVAGAVSVFAFELGDVVKAVVAGGRDPQGQSAELPGSFVKGPEARFEWHQHTSQGVVT